MLKKLLLLFVSFVTVGGPLSAQTFNKARLDSLLDALAANNKSMGSLAISQNGKLIYQKSIGYAAADSPATIAASAQTKYRIGSISKMFTGVMVMQLIDEGKLKLETTLDKFYPAVPNAAKITIDMLLTHHSGLHNFTNDPTYLTYMLKPQTQAQMMARITAMTPDFEPGSKGEYSNTNFVLLSYVVEKLTHKTYAEAVKQRVIDKAGLKDTYYGGKTNTANNEALSYTYDGKWKKFLETDMSIPTGAGSMVSTPADLDKFIEALFSGKLVKPAALAQMKTLNGTYGKAMFKIPFYEKAGYGHNGAIDAYQSTLVYFPDEKLAVAYIKNGGTYSPNDVLIGALNIYFNKPYTIPGFAEVKGLDKYTGTYAGKDVPLKITVTNDGSTLMAQATGQSAFPLVAGSTADSFEYEAAGIVMEFRPDKKEFTLKQGGKEYLFVKE